MDPYRRKVYIVLISALLGNQGYSLLIAGILAF